MSKRKKRKQKTFAFSIGLLLETEKKKATTSLLPNVCSFLVLTKIKKQKTLPLLADLKQKEKQQTLSFFVCSFLVSNRIKKKRFPSSSLETNKQQQAFSSWVCSSFDFAQNEQKYKNLDKRRILFTLGQVGKREEFFWRCCASLFWFFCQHFLSQQNVFFWGQPNWTPLFCLSKGILEKTKE